MALVNYRDDRGSNIRVVCDACGRAIAAAADGVAVLEAAGPGRGAGRVRHAHQAGDCWMAAARALRGRGPSPHVLELDLFLHDVVAGLGIRPAALDLAVDRAIRAGRRRPPGPGGAAPGLPPPAGAPECPPPGEPG